MTPSPASRSDRPSRAVGPLAVALVGLLMTVGLASAGAAIPVRPPIATPSAVDLGGVPARADSDPRQGAADGTKVLELRRRTGSAAPAGPPQPPTDVRTTTTAPRVRVVDATARRPASPTTQPVRIRVKTAGIDVDVRATGVAEDGSMELPDTVRQAGWYRYSARPGARTGRTVIAAHVDTRAEGLGPFARLTEAGRGDAVVVTDDDGTEHRYRITSRRQVPRRSLPVDELFDRNGPPGLVLLTCGGAYDARNGYRDNVVVVAEVDR